MKQKKETKKVISDDELANVTGGIIIRIPMSSCNEYDKADCEKYGYVWSSKEGCSGCDSME